MTDEPSSRGDQPDPPDDPTSPLPPLGPPQFPDPPQPSQGGGIPKWLLPVAAGAVILLLGAVLAFVLLSGDDDSATASSAEGPSAEYLSAVSGPVARLNRSAEITGRALTRASRSRDVARIARTADQQLTVVVTTRARIADIPAGPADRAARGSLSRATQAHRTLLTSLARLDDLETAQARAQVKRIRTQSQRVLGQYRAFFAEAPSLPKGITSAGLTDLSGLNQALADKLKKEQEAAAADEASGGGGEGDSGGSSSSSSSRGPVITSPYGSDIGSLIEVGAQYCDRTPGAVNDFIYSFQIRRGGAVLAEDSYGASQTRACNSISTTFNDSFGLGSYEVVVSVNNLTNNVSASAVGSLNVTN